MPTWKVELSNNIPEWLNLPATFTSPEARITLEDGKHYLSAAAFAALTDADEVYSAAQRLLQLVTAIVDLRAKDQISPAVECVVRINDDGTQSRRVVRSVTAFVALARLSASGTMIGPDGKPVPSSPPEEEKWLACAQLDSGVEKALRLFTEEHTWSNLYRIYEVIEGDIMARERIRDDYRAPGDVMQKIDSYGWAKEADIKLFRGVANSPAKIGDHARHGHEPRKIPPAGTMTHGEADALIRHIMQSWVRSKC